MRMMKLALVTFAALLFGSASASAITVKKRTEAPACRRRSGRSSATSARSRPGIRPSPIAWRPKRATSTFRTLTLKDGGKIKEKLTGTEDLGYTYEIVESPLPVKNYKSKLWLEVDDEPDRSVIYLAVRLRRQWRERRRRQEEHHRHPRRRREGHQEEGDRRLGCEEAAAGKTPDGDKDDDDDKN